MDKLLDYINNYFYKFKERGTYEIKDDVLIGVRGKYFPGQYIMIRNSFLNDTVFKIKAITEKGLLLEESLDETFEGYVCSLAIPRNIIEIEKKISDFNNDPTNKHTNRASVGFGSQTVSLATNKNGAVMTWKDVFKEDLRPYFCMYDKFPMVKEVR